MKDTSPPCRYVCVPMMADGESLGVFHVRAEAITGDGLDAANVSMSLDELGRRANEVSARLALPIANLKLRERLSELTFQDPLTQVFNRRYLDEALQRELSRAMRHQQPLAVAMFDLDHFKKLNDTFGHEMGDEVLRMFGAFLTSRLRKSDVVCRYGGEEFVVICPESTADDVAKRIDDIRDTWASIVVKDKNGSEASATFSAGVAEFARCGLTADALVRAADLALYQAKSLGRNRVIVCDAREAPQDFVHVGN